MGDVLLKRVELDAIKAGEVTVVFRRWRRPTVKSGGTLKSPVGLLAIEQVAKINRSDISERDAARAGHRSLDDLLNVLDAPEGTYYRITLRYAGADPRLRLRENDTLGQAEFEEVRTRLKRLDSASRLGAWTLKILRAIERFPNLAAVSLAERTGCEKEWLKMNIRKLKNLGLTISHHPGYELSPRGKVVLARLAAATDAW